MTETTLIFARILGVYFLIAGLGVMMRRETMGQFVARFREDEVLVFIAGVIALVLGVAILTLHYEWGHALAAAVTLIGWAAALKGAALILFGSRVMALGRVFDASLHVAFLWGLLIAVIGAGLAWVGWFGAA